MKRIMYVLEYWNVALQLVVRQEFKTHTAALSYRERALTVQERKTAYIVIEERFIPGHDA